MFRHVALFRFVPEATAEQHRAAADALRGLPAQIPELRAFQVGANLGLHGATHDLAVVADFDDEPGYRTYAAHPAHEAVAAEFVRPILAERAAVQFVG